MKLPSTWKDLIGLIYPKDYGLFEEVNLAAEDPAGYFEEYQQELSERGIENAAEVSIWLALIDGLLSRRCLVEVEKQAGAQDLVSALSELTVCRESRVELGPIGELTSKGTALLAEASNLLGKYNLAIGVMELDSDSWPIVVIPKVSLLRAREIAAKLSHEIIVS
jgi:hypothetical protein